MAASRIAWYENDGNEAFTAHTLSVVADSAFSVFAADVNGDDKIDVISASGNSIGWWENGSGDFTKHVFGGEGEIHSVFAADVDGDGDTDLLTASRFSNKIAWFENDGSQNFTSHTISSDAQFARSVFAADMDGDGDIDVLSASSKDDKIAWYENDGSQNFTARTISTATDAASSVFAVDMDGDGDLDVLSASAKDGKIAWYENLSPISGPVADLTGNGFVDFEDLTVLLGNWNRSVSAVEGNLVDAAGTPVNFEDLTVLLADWTGPGPAASPVLGGLAATIAPVGRRAESRAGTLHRLHAAATDRVLADYEPNDLQHREMLVARRLRRGR